MPPPTVPGIKQNHKVTFPSLTGGNGTTLLHAAYIELAQGWPRGQTDLEVFVEKLLNQSDLAQESSGKGDSWKLETFQMEPCG